MQKPIFSEPVSLKKFLLKSLISKSSLLRLGISATLAISITLVLIYVSYLNYWTKTIYRTQTVDFNILLNLMPAKLSAHLISGDIKELQKTLDSNYGLFGIVVTNCKAKQTECAGQEITYLSKGKVINIPDGRKMYQNTENYANNWQAKLKTENLPGQVYAILRNPPPSVSEMEYQNPRQNNVTSTGYTNSGKIIGRVYFLRNLEPPFLNELYKWLKNPLSASSGTLLNNSIALATLFTSFLVWLMLEFFYYKAILIEQRVVEIEKQNLLNLAKKYEAEKIAAIAISDKAEAENRELIAKNDALRVRSLWDGFQESFEQDFSAVLANRIEELRGFFRRLYTDIDNIIHDVRKAPLLLKEGNSKDEIIDVLSQQFSILTDAERAKLIGSIAEFISDTDETVKSIDWVLKDLRQVANLEQNKAQLQDIIQKFLEDKPPHLRTKRITVEFDDRAKTPLWILCNEWHLKSIIKNVLYNCTAALTNFQIKQKKNKQEFQGKIVISCFEDESKACISIEDNGSGYPEDYLDKLYQTPERVNPSKGRGRGSLIVYSYLQLHYAEVKLENVPTGGGRVTFCFPITSFPLNDTGVVKQPEDVVSTNT